MRTARLAPASQLWADPVRRGCVRKRSKGNEQKLFRTLAPDRYGMDEKEDGLWGSL